MRIPLALSAVAMLALSGAASAQDAAPAHHRVHPRVRTGIYENRPANPDIRTVPYPWENRASVPDYSYDYSSGYSVGIDNPSNLNNDGPPGGYLSESAGPHGQGVSQF